MVAQQPLEYYFLRFHYTETYEEKEQWIYRSSAEASFSFGGNVHGAKLRPVGLFVRAIGLALEAQTPSDSDAAKNTASWNFYRADPGVSRAEE
jgi:hypothetical protein